MRATEQLQNGIAGFDTWPASHMVTRLFKGQVDALDAVGPAFASLERGGLAMASAISSGNTLIYAAAGSSALMAMADGMELPGTYGIAPKQIGILMAGGIPQNAMMPGSVEDDEQAAFLAAAKIGKGDVVIAISASGTTPYVLTIAARARANGGTVIGIANHPDAELLKAADIPICLETPSEVIAGSTRMGAGTAQKVALNIMSTLMGAHLGHVHDGMMVNLIADNIKLTARAMNIVKEIAKVDSVVAEQCLKQTKGAVKPAILLALGAVDPRHAGGLLKDSNGHLRPAMERL